MVELPKLTNTEVALGAGAIGIALGVGGGAVVGAIRKRHGKRKKTKNKRSRKRVYRGRKLKFGSKAWRKKYLKHGGRHRRKQRKPHTAGKRRDTSRRRIRFTKNNQPYVILSSGKARFISKKSLSNSRKRSGGRY